MEENRNVYKVLVGKSGAKRLPGRYRHGGKYIIEVDLKETGLYGLDSVAYPGILFRGGFNKFS